MKLYFYVTSSLGSLGQGDFVNRQNNTIKKFKKKRSLSQFLNNNMQYMQNNCCINKISIRIGPTCTCNSI